MELGAEEALDDAGFLDTGEALIEALELEGEALVVQTGGCEDRGMEIVHADFVDGGFEAYLIALAMMVAAFDATSGHPDGEGMGIVIAARLVTFLGDG